MVFGYGVSSKVDQEMIRKYLTLIISGIVVVALALGSVWLWRTAQGSIKTKIAEERVKIEEEAAVLRDELTSQHMATVRRLRNENGRIRAKLEATIVDNVDCDLPPDAILYLNKARGVSEATSLDAGANAAPATHLSQQGWADIHAKDGEQCQLYQERVNQFIQWHR